MSFRPALMVHVVHREFLVSHEKKRTPFFRWSFTRSLFTLYVIQTQSL